MFPRIVDAQGHIVAEQSYSKVDSGHAAVNTQSSMKAGTTRPEWPIVVNDAGQSTTQDRAQEKVTKVVPFLMATSHGANLMSASESVMGGPCVADGLDASSKSKSRQHFAGSFKSTTQNT